MADNIVVSVTDQVSNSVAAKFTTIATNARAASSAVAQLQQQLVSVGASNALNAALAATKASTSQLTSAVNSLTAQFTALNTAQSGAQSGLAGFTNTASSAAQALGSVGNAAAQTGRSMQSARTQTNGFGSSLANFSAGAVVVNAVKDSVTELIRELFSMAEKFYDGLVTIAQWQAGLDRYNIGLKQVSGSAAGFTTNNEFVRKTVQDLGLDLNTTGNAFIKLAAATQGTVLQGQATQQIFQSVAEAATVLHLSTQQVNNTFLALEQMVSKGTVSMEELRRQLGNNIPGAMQLAADAMGVTTSQLTQMIKQGQVMADDFLPRFAQAIHDKYGASVEDASNSAQAGLNRLSTAWTDLERAIADSGLGKAASGQLSILTDALNGVSEAMARAKAQGSGFWGQAGAAADSVMSFLSPYNALNYQAQSYAGIQAQLKQKQSDLSNTKDFYAANQLKYDISQLEKKLADLQSTMPTPTDASAGNLSADQLAKIQEQNNQAAVSKFLSTGKHQTRQQELQAALTEVDNEFKQATAHLQAGSDLYNQALAAATARKTQLQENYDKAGIRTAHRQQQNELSAEIQQWQGYADDRKQILQTDLANLQEQRNNGLLTEKDYIKSVGQAHADELTDLQAIAEKQAELAAGKDQLAVRQRYIAESKKLGEQLVTNAQDVQTQLSALAYKTTQTAQQQLLSLQQAGANQSRSNSNALLGIGLSSNQQAELSAYQQIQQRADAARLALTQQATKLGTLDSPEYVKGLQAISDAEQEQLTKEKAYFEQRDALQSDWKNGASAALNTFLDSSKNVAGQTQTLFTNAFNGLTDALTTFVTTGKLSFGDLINSMIAGLIKMELQAAESQIFQSLFSYIGIGATSGGTAALAGFASGGYTGNLGAHQIAGVVHGGEFVFDAQSTNKIGVANLMSMMKSAKGYDTGGYVGNAYIQNGSSAPAVAQTNLSVNITNNASDQVAITAKQSTDSAGNPTLEIMANLIEGQLAGKITQGRGKLHDAVSSKFGLRSIPGR